MAVPTSGIKLEDVRTELGLSFPTSLNACISEAGKTGVWNKLSDFAGYSAVKILLSLSETTINIDLSAADLLITITSSGSWEVFGIIPGWMTAPNPSSGGSGVTVSIHVLKNLDFQNRTGTIEFRLTDDNIVTASLTINQSA